MTTTYAPDDTSVEPPVEDIEALLDLDDEEFALVVSDALFYYIGPVDDEPDWQCLFHPDVVNRTVAALLVARHAVEKELSDSRRGGSRPPLALVQRFKGIEARQTQAKKIRPTRVRDQQACEARESRSAIRTLALAIQRHRLSAIAAGFEPEPGDRELWAVLDEVRVPLGGGPATLTEMLGSGAWTEDAS